MSMNASVSTSSESGRWDRRPATKLLSKFLGSQADDDVSQRTFAEEEGVPRATLQYWLKRHGKLNMEPEAIAFFESPVGLAFLHRVVVALHLVLGGMGGGGIRLICMLIEMCGLDGVVAASYGVHQKVASQMQEALVDYGVQERTRLAATMPHRKITVVEEETFLSWGIGLVALAAVSGFVLVEEYADKRDTATWNAALARGTAGLNVEVVQSTADEAQALARHAKDQGAHHSPDLFHVQHEVNSGMSLPLLRQWRNALQAVDEAKVEVEQHHADRDAYRSGPRGGRPPDFAGRIEKAEAKQALAESALKAAEKHRQDWLSAVRGLGRLYHPFDLKSGASRSPESLASDLDVKFDELRRIANEVALSTSARSSIEKAARVAPKMVDTLRFFHDSVQKWSKGLTLPVAHEVLLQSLVPVAYLSRVIERETKAEKRTVLRQNLHKLLEPLFAKQGVLATLSEKDRDKLEQAAFACADLFQRSSSCVEGRNGRLSQWEHSQRRLSPKKLQGLTVIHNYFIQRSDDTTAAERFFGTKPRDLFDWLLERIPAPPRPAAKRRNPRRIRPFKPA